MPVSPVAGQAICGGFRANVIGSGILLEKSFEFLDPVNRAVGGAAGADKSTLRQTVECCRTDADGLRGLNSVQSQFGNCDRLLNV